MAWRVQTMDGVLVQKDTIGGHARPLVEEEAEASADERNRRAEELEIKTRYEAVEV